MVSRSTSSEISCRDCGQRVEPEILSCPECGAPRPGQAEWSGEGYEWKSEATWMGSPMVHIAFGIDAAGKIRTARGIVAVGQRANGVIACGWIATGVISIGVISFGVVSVGVLSVAALAAVGVNAFAPIAFGLTSMGYLVGGLAPFGWKLIGAHP